VFSYLCKVCGENIKANANCGEITHLYFLHNGRPVELMTGQYDGNGSIYLEGLQNSYNWDFAP